MATRQLCHDYALQYKQNTGNCVVKNLLAATKQYSLDIYGEKGLAIFQSYYQLLMISSLKLAQENSEKFLEKPLLSLSRLCVAIQGSQEAFRQLPCQETLYKDIISLYKLINTQTFNSTETIHSYSPRFLPKKQYNLVEENTCEEESLSYYNG